MESVCDEVVTIVTQLSHDVVSRTGNLGGERDLPIGYGNAMASITADLTAGAVVELRNGRHVWTADEPVELDGTDTGPNPYEMLLGALAACTCITISYYCKRKGWKLDSVSATYTYDRIHADDCGHCDDDATGFMHSVTSEIFMDGDFDDEQRARLEDIAKKCPVHRTLEAGLVFDEKIVF